MLHLAHHLARRTSLQNLTWADETPAVPARKAETSARRDQARESPMWAPSNKQQSLDRMEESSRTATRKLPRGRSPRKPPAGPAQTPRGPVETSNTSFGSASTASTTPEPLRKRMQAELQRRSYAPVRGKRAGSSLPPLSAALQTLKVQEASPPATDAQAYDFGEQQKVGLLPSIGQETPRVEAQLNSKLQGSPRLLGRGHSQPPNKPPPRGVGGVEAPKSARRPMPAAMAAAAVSLMPEVTDMRALLGDLDAKHAGSGT